MSVCAFFGKFQLAAVAGAAVGNALDKWTFFLCVYMLLLHLNVFGQYVHVYKSSPVCNDMCSFQDKTVKNN